MLRKIQHSQTEPGRNRNMKKQSQSTESETMTKFGNSEFSDKPTNFYNLDVIISVGYRVKSKNGIIFRRWANKVLKDYLIKVIQ